MKRRNIAIICIAVIGLLALGLVELAVKPSIARKKLEYAERQRSPLTHDFSSVLKYKNKYMGNASNLANLNHNLPLGEAPFTLHLLPKQLTAEINYKEAAGTIGRDRVELAVIYNAAANFVLIDNLEEIVFNFTDESFRVGRKDVAAWLKVGLAELKDKDNWNERVQSRLQDGQFVREFYEGVVREVK